MIRNPQDLHVLKYFTSFISVSGGKVIHVTEPALAFCPLASHLYPSCREGQGGDSWVLRGFIKDAIESKIRDFGYFTGERKFFADQKRIPYGASEMISTALKKEFIDSAVIVCEGAGTVITDHSDLVQGIGARMNTLLMTSPISGILKKLYDSGVCILSDTGRIDQMEGVREAVKRGGQKIAVTVSGVQSTLLPQIREIEKESGAQIYCLSVCTTGIEPEQIELIRKYSDLVWSCASGEVRKCIGKEALIQLSELIPVFVLSEKGLRFTQAYGDAPELLSGLKPDRQYLISVRPGMRSARLGNRMQFLSEAKLPVNTERVFRFREKEKTSDLHA